MIAKRLEDNFIKPGVDLDKEASEISQVVNLSKQELRERWNGSKAIISRRVIGN